MITYRSAVRHKHKELLSELTSYPYMKVQDKQENCSVHLVSRPESKLSIEEELQGVLPGP